MISVEEVMTPKPFTVTPEQSLTDARRVMAEKNIRHLPVVRDDGHLVGLVTQRDILAAMDSVPDPDRRHDESSVIIESFMKRDPVSVDPRGSLRSAAMFMEKHRYGCLPVVDQGKICGIITDSDYVAIAINLLEQAELMED